MGCLPSRIIHQYIKIIRKLKFLGKLTEKISQKYPNKTTIQTRNRPDFALRWASVTIFPAPEQPKEVKKDANTGLEDDAGAA